VDARLRRAWSARWTSAGSPGSAPPASLERRGMLAPRSGCAESRNGAPSWTVTAELARRSAASTSASVAPAAVAWTSACTSEPVTDGSMAPSSRRGAPAPTSAGTSGSSRRPRGHRNRLLRIPQRRVSGHRRQPVPVVREGAAHPGGGQPGQLRRGPLAALRNALRVAYGAAQLADSSASTSARGGGTPRGPRPVRPQRKRERAALIRLPLNWLPAALMRLPLNWLPAALMRLR